MATYRLFPSTNGPSTAQSYVGNAIFGVCFDVTQSGMWFEGFWWWVCGSGQGTSPLNFALWVWSAPSAIVTGTLVPNTTVTSGPLTAGQWNWVPLASPVPLSVGTVYIAAVGCNGSFPYTPNSFSLGDVYSAGITNGPLNGFSNYSGSNPATVWNSQVQPQGSLSVAGSDPSVTCPLNSDTSGDHGSNFWIDLQVSDTIPGGYAGSYRIWPNQLVSDGATEVDSPVNYVIGTEVDLSQACTANNVWFYSIAGTAQLPTRCDVWRISNGAAVASIAAPSWSGAPGSGWVSAAFAPGVVIPSGKYRVSVYNDAVTPDGWSAKRLHYWESIGPGYGGLASGPLAAPDTAHAQNCYKYDGGNPGSTPPYSSGILEPGQSVFAQSGVNAFPQLYVDGLFQNYWVDIEVTPAPVPNVPPYIASMASM